MNTTNPNDPKAQQQGAKPLAPSDLANQLFDAVFLQANGDHREAARQVINFLMESLVYAVVATSRNDEVARKALLKDVGEKIINAATNPQYQQPQQSQQAPSKP